MRWTYEVLNRLPALRDFIMGEMKRAADAWDQHGPIALLPPIVRLIPPYEDPELRAHVFPPDTDLASVRRWVHEHARPDDTLFVRYTKRSEADGIGLLCFHFEHPKDGVFMYSVAVEGDAALTGPHGGERFLPEQRKDRVN